MKPYTNKRIRVCQAHLLYSEIRHGKKAMKSAERAHIKRVIKKMLEE
jgi:hypothetical protein